MASGVVGFMDSPDCEGAPACNAYALESIEQQAVLWQEAVRASGWHRIQRVPLLSEPQDFLWDLLEDPTLLQRVIHCDAAQTCAPSECQWSVCARTFLKCP